MPSQHIPQPPETSLVETRIEDGKLLYERRWYLQFVSNTIYISSLILSKCKKNLWSIFINRFHRGQPVYVEGKDLSRFAANISAIGTEAVSIRGCEYWMYYILLQDIYFSQIWVKKVSDSSKVRIYTSQLSRGKISIKRRAS